MGKVIAICTSPAKGTQKTRIEEGTFIEDFGLEGDAHAGKNGIVRSVFFLMTRSRHSVQEVQK